MHVDHFVVGSAFDATTVVEVEGVGTALLASLADIIVQAEWGDGAGGPAIAQLVQVVGGVQAAGADCAGSLACPASHSCVAEHTGVDLEESDGGALTDTGIVSLIIVLWVGGSRNAGYADCGLIAALVAATITLQACFRQSVGVVTRRASGQARAGGRIVIAVGCYAGADRAVLS